jgi:predicted transcriptional regulator
MISRKGEVPNATKEKYLSWLGKAKPVVMRGTRRRKVKTVQMTLSEDLVSEVDRLAKKIGTTRSEFTRRALQKAIAGLREKEMERRQRKGYMKKPVKPGEFSDWETEQAWGK